MFRCSATISISRWFANSTSKLHGGTTTILQSVPLTGSTNNAKLAFNWLVDDLTGTTIRGTWGTSFRFANAGEFSEVLSPVVGSYNITGGTFGTVSSSVAATGNRLPVPLLRRCSRPVLAAAAAPGGTAYGGAPTPLLREYISAATGQLTTREGGYRLAPEKSHNYSAGFELRPRSISCAGSICRPPGTASKSTASVGIQRLNPGYSRDPTSASFHLAERSRLPGGGQYESDDLCAIRNYGRGRSDRSPKHGARQPVDQCLLDQRSGDHQSGLPACRGYRLERQL